MAEIIKSISVLNEHYENTLSALQDLKDELLGNRVQITFHSTGGSPVKNVVVYMKQSFGELPKPYRPGYDFAGWYKTYDTESVPGEEFFDGLINDFDPVSVEIHYLDLYAKWDPAWIPVHLNANGGIVEPEEISVRYLTRFSEAYQGAGMPRGLPYPTHPSNRFTKWTTEIPGDDGTARGNLYDNNTMMTLTEGFYLYANWDRMIYYMSYDMNGGRGELEKTSAIVGLTENNQFALSSVEQAIEIGGASKVGYDLIGFSLMRNSNAVLTGDSVACTGRDITVYAVWRRHSYQIEYRKDNYTKLKTKNQDPTATPWNPQTLLLDWIDYLNFLDEFSTEVRGFRRWTSVTDGNGNPSNPFVARLMPYDGDMVYNYVTGQGETVAIRPATKNEIAEVEKWTLVPNSVGVHHNPLEGMVLNHGDTLSSVVETPTGLGYFLLSAQLSMMGEGGQPVINNLSNLSADSIRVYPSMARYIPPETPTVSTDNSFAVVSFAWNDITYGAKVPLTVKRTLSYVEIYSRPKKTEYRNGDTLDPSGLALSVVYADGAESEIVKWYNSEECPIFCTMDEERQPTANKTVTLLNKTMYIHFDYGGVTVKTSINLEVMYSTEPTLSVEARGTDAKKSFEPDDDSEIVASQSGIDLHVFKVYENEPLIEGHDELKTVEVHDYVYYPKSVSENEITRLVSDPNYMGLVDLSVYYADTDFNITLTGTTEVSIYKPFGISSLYIAGDNPYTVSDPKMIDMPYKSRYVVVNPSIHLSDISLMGRFNRIGLAPSESETEVKIMECRVEPDMVDPTITEVSVFYGDSAPLTIPISVNLDYRCFCGELKLFDKLNSDSEIGLRSTKRINACLNHLDSNGNPQPINPAPLLNAQSFGGDFSYYYSGDKYVGYKVGGKLVMKKSEYDAEHIMLSDYMEIDPTGEWIILSVYYTDPTRLKEFNNHIFARAAAADANSIVYTANFGLRVKDPATNQWSSPSTNSISAIRNFGAYQERLRHCMIGDEYSSLTEIGHNCFTNCKDLGYGLVLPSSHNNDIGVVGGKYRDSNGNLVQRLILPPNTTRVREYAFYHCEGFTQMVPWGINGYGGVSAREVVSACTLFRLSSLGECAFEGMTRLANVNARIFGRYNSAGDPWGNPLVVGLPERCFKDCTALTAINIGEVKYLQTSAFYGCRNLDHITVANDFSNTFSYGGQSHTVNVRYSLAMIGSHVFGGNPKITAVNGNTVKNFNSSKTTVNKYACS